MFKIGFVKRVASYFPQLKIQLRIAHSPLTPLEFVKKQLVMSALYSFLFSVLFFLLLKKSEKPLFLIVPIYAVTFILVFEYGLLTLKSKIRKREREIDKEVIFIGRYLLVKLYSGRPLLNALIETANGRGIASRYIKELVDDINTGNTIEDALSNAMIYSPSEKLKKILFHITNALQLGIDVTDPLESVIEELTKEEELEIKKYGKKLNSLVIFYMLGAVIIPSLGMTIFIVISSFINFKVDLKTLMVVAFFIVILQFIFITLFKVIRPVVNL